MLEHDDDDRYITRAVFDENRYPVKINFVENSNDLFAFLISCEKNGLPFPALILLNYNAAPASAIDILGELKNNSKHAHIPVVVLSGTFSPEMVRRCYSMGANSFIQKPSSTALINDKISTFVKYWYDTVELP
jgi:response regulator RpfG family c-di-GMP phosphodiesterase